MSTFKALKDLLPSGPNREEAERLIALAEKEMRIADAKAARAFGYPICKRHYPPGIMVEKSGNKRECLECGQGPEPSLGLQAVYP